MADLTNFWTGPLSEAIRLVTHNSTELVHVLLPDPPQSLSLLKPLLSVGYTANTLLNVYPAQKWHGCASPSRRFLNSTEAWRLRRALYRLWLYSNAFHNYEFCAHQRNQPHIVRMRAALLRPWSTAELAEMLDVQNILRSLLAYYVCPSNGTALTQYRERYACDPIYISRPSETRTQPVIDGIEDPSEYPSFAGNRFHDTAGLWDGISSRHSTYEDRVRIFVNRGGVDWFNNNGQTFGETMQFVMNERGEVMEALRQDVEEGIIGVVNGAFF